MTDEFYATGVEHLLEDLVLEKVAYMDKEALVGFLGRGALAGAMALGKGVGSGVAAPFKAYSKHIGSRLGNVAQGWEKGLGNVAGKHLSPANAQRFKSTIKGMPEDMLRQGVGSGLVFGGVEGGVGAASAEPGDKLTAGLRGFGQGFASGALTGAVGGGMYAGGKNLTGGALGALAKSKGVPDAAAQGAKQLDRGFWGSAKDLFSKDPNKSNLGRVGAGVTAGGIGGSFVADWMLQDHLLKAMEPKQLQEPYPGTPAFNQKYGEEAGDPDAAFHRSSAPILSSATGAGIGGASAFTLAKALRAKNKIPLAAAELAPYAGGTVGSVGGYLTAQGLYPTEREQQLRQMEQVDFDKLLRYYKSKPEQGQ